MRSGLDNGLELDALRQMCFSTTQDGLWIGAGPRCLPGGQGTPAARAICSGTLWGSVTLLQSAADHRAGVTIPPSGGLAIPKSDVVGTVQVLLQTRRPIIARDLPDAPLLVRELERYRPTVTLHPANAVAWRDGRNDDLVLAVALAAWAGEIRRRAGEWAENRQGGPAASSR
jgi:hypothetical protein